MRGHGLRPVRIAVLAAIIGALWLGHYAQADELTAAVEEQAARYAKQLADLARWCEEEQLPEQARKTRTWLVPHDPNKLYVIILPEAVGRPKLPEDAPEGLVEWDQRFYQLRRDQAGALFALAQRAHRSGRASLAFDLLMAALRENPDHETIRQMLGYQKYRDNWHTLFEVNKLRVGQVWHEKFGWLARSSVRRYEQGQRQLNGKWISAEEDARWRRNIEQGWEIETEHYLIRTNHSIEAAVALGKKLEKLYRVWKQLFVRYYATEDQVAALFSGRGRTRINLPRLKVAYFRDREDYNRELRQAFPNIEVSVGIYVESMRRAYFFAGDQYDEQTMYHEATHQLFHESRPAAMGVGSKANFWIIEGIAMYMETLHDEGEFHVLGGLDGPRMRAARYRLLHDKFYIPLSEFSTLTMLQVQADPKIATLYSQAAGLTHFLIHHDGGRYRDALVAYLEAVYQRRDDARTLSLLTRTGYGELDKQYRQFIEKAGLP